MDTLDAAWAAVEAALPEGWLIGGLQLEQDDNPIVADDWHAWAGSVNGHCRTCDCGPALGGRGATPVAALRALATALTEKERNGD